MPNANEYKGTPELPQQDAGLRAAYERARRALTAEQLQRFELEEPVFPFEDVLEELEAVQQQRKSQEAS